jgi:hypothetical protein
MEMREVFRAGFLEQLEHAGQPVAASA